MNSNPPGKTRSPAASPGDGRPTPTSDASAPIIPSPSFRPNSAITVDYAFAASGHHYAGVGQGHCHTSTATGQAIAALLADIEGSLKTEHGEGSRLIWWTVRVKAKEPAG